MNNPFKFEKPKDSLNNLFGAPKDQITREIPISELYEITEQPFNAYNDEALNILVDDIRENGLLSPLVVAPIDGGYEIIAGRNRYRACKKLGMEKLPCIVRNNLNVAKRNLILVASNLMQRQRLLPSEKAKAYKMHKDACDELKIKFKPDLLESSANVYKYLRLNALLPEIMQMLDNDEITFSICYEIAGLNSKTQKAVYEYLQSGKTTSASGILRLKDYEKSDAEITAQLIELCEAVKPMLKETQILEQEFYHNIATPHFNAQNRVLKNDLTLSQQTLQSKGNSAHNANKTTEISPVLVKDKANPMVYETQILEQEISINNSKTDFNAENSDTESELTMSRKTNQSSDNSVCSANNGGFSAMQKIDENPDKSVSYKKIDLQENDTLTIQRAELPWTLKHNCDMEKLKKFIIGKLPKLSQEYFDMYPAEVER